MDPGELLRTRFGFIEFRPGQLPQGHFQLWL